MGKLIPIAKNVYYFLLGTFFGVVLSGVFVYSYYGTFVESLYSQFMALHEAAEQDEVVVLSHVEFEEMLKVKFEKILYVSQVVKAVSSTDYSKIELEIVTEEKVSEDVLKRDFLSVVNSLDSFYRDKIESMHLKNNHGEEFSF